MKEFSYEAIDRKGRPINGTTAAESAQDVKAQLQKFGFNNIRVKTAAVRAPAAGTESSENLPEDYVQKLVDGEIDVRDLAAEQEAEEDEWRRAEAIQKIQRRRKRETVGLTIFLVVLGIVVLYFVYEKATAITAPQPTIIMRSGNPMLSFKDVYVKDNELCFTVFSRDWNGNVRVDFKAWDPFDEQIDFGIARLGNIGEHYGGSAEKSSQFKLKKRRFYERIEILVSGDEGK